MSSMNQRQQEAVDTLDGPLLLLAGAGTGKTTVIVHRIANLVQHGIPPRAILAVTFTRKAAREMQERISAFVGPQRAGEMTISTFHAFCVKVLRRHIALLGYNPHFTIGQEGDRIGLVAEIMTQLRQIGQGYNRDLWCDRISMAKAAGLTPVTLGSSDSLIVGDQVVAIVAPAFIGQFGKFSTPERFTTAMKTLGFAGVVEVAVGADICTIEEAKDFLEKVPGEQPYMATSCCPAWHEMVYKLYPDQSKNISMTLTPMVFTAAAEAGASRLQGRVRRPVRCQKARGHAHQHPQRCRFCADI